MQSIRRNVIYNTIYQIYALIIPLITAPYISRVLGADGIGVFSYTSSVMAFFLLAAALGTASYGSREIARSREDPSKECQTFWEIVILTALSTAITLTAWVGMIAFGDSYYKWQYIALTPSLIAVAFDISWFYIGKELIKDIVFRNVLVKTIGIASLFLFVKDKGDLTLYILLQSISTLIGNISMWFHLPVHIRKPSFQPKRIAYHLQETMIYFIPTISTSIYTVLDKVLIGLMTRNVYENGYYEQATKIINIVKTVVFTSVNMVMGARISYLFSIDAKQEIKEKIGQSLNFIMLVGIGATFGLIGIANRFVPWFFGPGFEPVITLIQIMAPIILIIGISNCLGSQYYNPSGRRAFSAKVIILGAIVNLILNLMLIPYLGGIGATMASILAETLISILYVRNCNGFITISTIWNVSAKRFVAGSIMLTAVLFLGYVLPFSNLTVIVIQIFCGSLLYFAVLLVLKDTYLLDFLGETLSKYSKRRKDI